MQRPPKGDPNDIRLEGQKNTGHSGPVPKVASLTTSRHLLGVEHLDECSLSDSGGRFCCSRVARRPLHPELRSPHHLSCPRNTHTYEIRKSQRSGICEESPSDGAPQPHA